MVTTPDSIPSLGEISRDSTNAEDVSRILFQTPEHEFTEVALGYSQSQFVGEDDKDSLFGSDISIATVGDNTLGYGRTGRFSLPSPLRPEFDDNENPGTETYPGSCLGSLRLSPRKLSAIFNIFDASQQNEASRQKSTHSKSDNSVNDAVTEITSNIDQSVVTWERQIDTLERECATLKDIIKADSITILRLKTELSVFQEAGQLWSCESQRAPNVGHVKSEEDSSQHLETIKLLNQKINELTNARNATKKVPKELEQFRLENELFASQIIDNENELSETRATVKHLEGENAKLKLDLANQLGEHKQAYEKRPERLSREERSLDYLLITQVASLTARIAEIERDMEGRYPRVQDNDCSETDETLGNSIKAMILPKSNGVGAASDLESSGMQQFAEINEVEVTIQGLIITSSGSSGANCDSPLPSQPKVPEIFDQRSGICDCLRPVSTMAEV